MLTAFPGHFGTELHIRSNYATRHTLTLLASHRWEMSLDPEYQVLTEHDIPVILTYSDSFCLCELHESRSADPYRNNSWRATFVAPNKFNLLDQYFGSEGLDITSAWQGMVEALGYFQKLEHGVDHYTETWKPASPRTL
jgi:hypothetical protein